MEAHSGSMPAEFCLCFRQARNVVLTALKKAEDRDALIFRVYEWAGKSGDVEFHVPKGATGATVTNLMEKPEGTALKMEDGVVTAPIHPFEILTVRVRLPSDT